MQRLINAYRKCPGPVNRAKLQAYMNKHMMAVCLLEPQDVEFLRVHKFTGV